MARRSSRLNYQSLSILTVVFIFLPELVQEWSALMASNGEIASSNNDAKVDCDRTHQYDIC